MSSESRIDKVKGQGGSSPIVTFEDNHYIINVAALEPDPEMTLMDVLQMCPEMISSDNKTLTAYYSVSVGGLDLLVDEEALLERTRAIELEKVEIYNYGMITENTNGGAGIIDLTYKKGERPISGKVSAQGSTYGNGALYANMLAQGENISFNSAVLGTTRFTRRRPSGESVYTNRSFVEGIYLGMDWDVGKSDNIKMLMTQEYYEGKEKMRCSNPEDNYTFPKRNRLIDITGIYTHTFNNDMEVFAEGSANYENYSLIGQNSHDLNTHIYSGVVIPCLNDRMKIKGGWDVDYLNYLTAKDIRYQLGQNDFYGQANYNIGRWLMSAGFRFGILKLWSLSPQNDGSESKKSEVHYTRCFTSTLGYRWGRNTVMGTISREQYRFFDVVQDPMEYEIDNYDRIIQDLMWRSELSYTYQTGKFVFKGGVYHAWGEEDRLTNHNILTVRASATWLTGRLRITAGADYNHQRTKVEDDDSYFKRFDNYYHLKLIPSLTMGKGFRLSSTMIFSSSKVLREANQHLYATIKLNKNLGKHCNIYAEFHDIAGLPDDYVDEVHGRFYNRAVTFGGSFYF